MNNGNGDFEEIKILLKLKRHEQPPPRYFNDFSSHVLAGIERSQPAGFMARLADRFPWLPRLKWALAENPISAGIFAVCGLMVVGFSSSQYFDVAAAQPEDVMKFAALPNNSVPASVPAGTASMPWTETALNQEALPSLASPAFMGAVPSSLFNGGLDLQPVSYSVVQ